MSATIQKTRVDLAGLMRVLGEALYSTPHVAIRELVQNAHDSCTRRELEDRAPAPAAITVTSAPGTLVITDNGAGLTLAEIHAYLATVGAGYTRNLRDSGKGDGLIGYFGLGFLSAFAVSEKIEVWTCSFQEPHLAHRFTSRSGETYTIEPAEPRPIGTELRLTLRPQAPELGNPEVVYARLQQYCCLLRHPVAMNGGTPVNVNRPPWRPEAPLSTLRERALALEFVRRFERTFEPITTILLQGNQDNPSGVLWVQDGGSYATSDNRNVSVFVRGMLISPDERDLLPRWAGFVGAVVESDSLRPTASRESLIEDETYAAHAVTLHRALIEGLSRIAEREPATWRRILSRHNEALLGAAIVDSQLFALVADGVTVPTTEGDFTLPALIERGAGKVYVTEADTAGVESVLLRALKLPVVLGQRFGAAAFCARYAKERRGQLALLGTQAGDGNIFQPANLDTGREQLLQQWFTAPDRDVLVRRFDPPFLPFALVVDRDAELKRRIESDEADRRIGQAVLGLARHFTSQIKATKLTRMYVNAANPAISALFDCGNSERERALALMQPLAALLGGNQAGADLEAALRSFTAALLDIVAGR
jgi:molecular chaperone HtpG